MKLFYSIAFAISAGLASTAANAQVYRSAFTSSAGHYAATSPICTVYLGPAFSNISLNPTSNIADNDTTNYAEATGLVSAGVNCSAGLRMRTDIGFPGGTTVAPAGYYAGFKLQFNSLLTLGSLVSNATIRTYRNDTLMETFNGATPGLITLSLLAANTPTYLSAQTSISFDEVELELNPSLLGLNLGVSVTPSYRYYFAFASAQPLPLTVTKFTAQAKNNDVQLYWQAVNDLSTDRFDIQRSEDGSRFTTIGKTTAIYANSGSSDYSYTDYSVDNNKSLYYRLSQVDKSGRTYYSKVVLINGKGGATTSASLYPTVVEKGHALTLKSNTNDPIKVYITNLQGQIERTLELTNGQSNISTESLSSGWHLLKATNNTAVIASQRFFVQ